MSVVFFFLFSQGWACCTLRDTHSGASRLLHVGVQSMVVLCRTGVGPYLTQQSGKSTRGFLFRPQQGRRYVSVCVQFHPSYFTYQHGARSGLSCKDRFIRVLVHEVVTSSLLMVGVWAVIFGAVLLFIGCQIVGAGLLVQASLSNSQPVPRWGVSVTWVVCHAMSGSVCVSLHIATACWPHPSTSATPLSGSRLSYPFPPISLSFLASLPLTSPYQV